MKRILVLSIAIFIALSFSSCRDSNPRTVEYFENDYKIAKDRYEECNKIKGTMEYLTMSENEKKDCENAYSALSKIKDPALEEFKYAYSLTKLYFHKFSEFNDISKMTIDGYDGKIKIKNKKCLEFIVKNKFELEIVVNRNEEICSIVFDRFKPDIVLLDYPHNNGTRGKVIFK